MYTHPFKLKIPYWFWVKQVVVVEYDCSSEPRIVGGKTIGLEQIGFIFGHQYVMETYVHDVKRVSCAKEECSNGAKYLFDLRLLIYEKVGLGFGFGGGTGVAGFTFGPREHVFQGQVPCICCDDEGFNPKPIFLKNGRREPRFDTTGFVVGLSALASGLTLSVLNFEHASGLPKIFIGTAGMLLGIAVLATGVRLLFRPSRKGIEEVAKADPPLPLHG